MPELLAYLFPILLIDIVNPVLFTVLVFAAGSARPVSNSAAILVGHTVAYFIAGIAISLGIEQIAQRLTNPQRIDFVIGGLVGAGLLWMALRTKTNGAPSADEPGWELTPLKCVAFGAVVNFIGVPFALPYFGAIDQILKADLSTVDALLALGAYNLVYALPFAIVPVAVAISGDSAKPWLEKINGFLVRASDILMPWLLGLLGLALLVDAALFFTRGTGLW